MSLMYSPSLARAWQQALNQQTGKFVDVGSPFSALSFTDFKRALYHRYEHPRHLAIIDAALQEAITYVQTRGEAGQGYQIFTMPPRHGKTLTISRFFPPYVLGTHPEWRVILASYGATLAYKNSRAARNIIQSLRYQQEFPGIALAQDSKAVDAWDLQGHEGGMDAMGVGGGVTGKGGHLIIVDDPVKSRAEAESEVYRDKVWDWFTDDLYTRREPGAAIVLVLTRWHQDDLAGRLLRNEPGKWRLINCPAIAEPDDVLGRSEGEALWPGRYPLPVLNDIQATMGEYSWSALYQQRPVPAEGGIFKRRWFEPYLDVAPPIVHAVRYWDLAMSEKTSADYTVGLKLGQAEDGHYYVLDVARRQIDWGDLTGWLASIMLGDGPAVAQGIEEKGYMSRAIQDLNADPRLHGYEIWGYPVDTDKLTRALPYAAKCGAGLVHVLNRHWTPEYIDELCSFPQGVYDDQVDASSGAWAMAGDNVAVGTGYMNYGKPYTITTAY